MLYYANIIAFQLYFLKTLISKQFSVRFQLMEIFSPFNWSLLTISRRLDDSCMHVWVCQDMFHIYLID